ncbi:AAA family ATPase [Desulfococcaceae bacterium HSG9]|nr:AAA family ATPase [Desulfococcaceae bacterium HSG9]
MPNTITTSNEKSLKRLIRTIRLSEGVFSLIQVRCNYTSLRRKMLDQIEDLSPSHIREIHLPDSVATLFTYVRDTLNGESPDALMITGLEAVRDIDSVLSSANQVREEFSKHFLFPVILWGNNDVLNKFNRIAPDFDSWAGSSIHFQPENSDLLDALQHHAEKWFRAWDKNRVSETRKSNGSYNFRETRFLSSARLMSASQSEDDGLEFFLKSFLEDAGERELDLEPQHQACLLFLQGRDAQNKGEWDAAISFYKQSLSFWEPTDERERKGVIRCFIAQCYEQQDHPENALSYFQACVQDFGTCEARLTDSVRDLCRILRKLKKWDELEKVAREASQNDYQVLANARQGAGDPQKTVKRLETERAKGVSASDPELFIEMLDALHLLYYHHKNYRKAFRVKQAKYALEHQYGFRAFIGAGRLKASRRTFQHSGTDVAREIRASGRQHDVKLMTEKISRADCKLIVIHGASGVGKSSVIEAGIEPALKLHRVGIQNVLPVLIRNYTGWVNHLYQKLTQVLQLPKPKEKIKEKDKIKEILAELGKNEQRNFICVLIFDQFEEFFFANSELDARRKFYQFLRDCLNTPFVKVILSLREDYLHYLLECERMADMAAISNNILDKNIRYALGNFKPLDAKAVMKSLTEHGYFHPQESLIDTMVDDLTSIDKEVRPIELQIVGSRLETENITSLDQYKSKKKLVQGFLDEVIHDCGQENEEAALLLLYLLTDENNTRPLKTLIELNGGLVEYEIDVRSGQSELILEILRGAGMVFLIPEEPEDRHQVVHDYLAELIRENTIPLLNKLEERKAEKKLQKRLKEQEKKRQKELERQKQGMKRKFEMQEMKSQWELKQKGQKMQRELELKEMARPLHFERIKLKAMQRELEQKERELEQKEREWETMLKGWIKILKQGKYPFTEEVLKKLRGE